MVAVATVFGHFAFRAVLQGKIWYTYAMESELQNGIEIASYDVLLAENQALKTQSAELEQQVR